VNARDMVVDLFEQVFGSVDRAQIKIPTVGPPIVSVSLPYFYLEAAWVDPEKITLGWYDGYQGVLVTDLVLSVSQIDGESVVEHPADCTGFVCKARTFYDQKIVPNLEPNTENGADEVVDILGTVTVGVPDPTQVLNLVNIDSVDFNQATIKDAHIPELKEAQEEIKDLKAKLRALIETIHLWAPTIPLAPELIADLYEEEDGGDSSEGQKDERPQCGDEDMVGRIWSTEPDVSD